MKELIKDIILFSGSLGLMALCGCATKTRSVDLAGMYASESGTLAIGSIEVMAAPEGEESATIKYSEDTAWLSPSTRTRDIKIMLTGTNSVSSATGIVKEICKAFTAVKGEESK